MSEGAIGGGIWLIVYLATAFNTFMLCEVVKGIHRARCDRVERELRDKLGEGLYFLVPARDENG